MHLLPNKNHIDIDSAVEAMLDSDGSNTYFLDTETGYIGCIAGSDGTDERRTFENIRRQPKRYFEVPRVSKAVKEKWMREFIAEMIPFEDPVFSEQLLDLPSVHFFENALKEVEDSKDGWVHGWIEWSHDCAYEMLDEWFSTLPVEITNKWEGCEDCAICTAMAQGKDSLPELLKAFSEENFIDEVEKSLQSGKNPSRQE